MTRSQSLIVTLIGSSMLTACGGWSPWGTKESDVSAQIPAGATEYACADNRRLLVRYAPDGKSAWVIYPDREFRLDRASAGTGERYTNGVSTLTTQGEETMLEESGTRLFTDCKRKQTGG